MVFPFKNKAMLAPMSGFSDVAFRALCRKYGCCLTFTEFVSANAIVQGNRKTRELLKLDPSEVPSAVQIFGGDVDSIVSAAVEISDGFDIVDINCGCPVPKVTKIGAGSELLRDPSKIALIVSNLVEKLSGKQISVKMRIGIDDNSINVVEIAKGIEKAGAMMITVHGRTRKQGYSGVANWNIIKEVKCSVKIPVIGNGDVSSPEEFVKRLEETGVDAIMIGRAALGNPYIFKQILDYVETGSYGEMSRVKQFREYLVLAKKYEINFGDIKAQAMYFTKGIVGGAIIRRKVASSECVTDIEDILKSFS